MDGDRLCAIRWFRATSHLPGVLGRLLRRRSFRHEGRLAAHGANARATRVPQLVPSPLSVCLCHVPLRGGGVMPLPSERIAPSALTDFATDVAEYLQRTPRQLPSRYFYDALGSALFDAICRLPWYRVTRSETALLARHAREILERLPRPLNITELGCGNGEKLSVLLEKGAERLRRVHLIDISGAALLSARARLATLPATPVTTFQGTYEQGLVRLVTHRSHGAWLVLFLGSNIGNF